MDQKTSGRGYRVEIEAVEGGVFFTCVTTAFATTGTAKTKDVQPKRTPFYMSRLLVYVATTYSEALRLVEHWASFYGDPSFTDLAVQAFRDFYDGLEGKNDDEPSVQGNAPGGSA